jgi:nucleoside-diphosphate-sugar epimerase
VGWLRAEDSTIRRQKGGAAVKDCILLTGATGALGSMLLQRLSREGYEVVCLVRAKDRSEARTRIQAIVGNLENVRVIRGDITEPRCGISDIDRELLVGRVKRVLHCAASVNFQDKNATQLTNVAGVLHILELTDILDAWHVLHVSTAYVIGDASYLAEKSLSIGQRWRNPYEESKFVGERMVRAWTLKRDERRFTIFRPSVLIGCEDGTTCTFDGHYRWFEPIHRVAESLRKRRGKPLPPDVHVEDNGVVRVPLAVLVADKRINYVPIDWVADMIVAAVEAPPRNETYHLVHHDPMRLRAALSSSLGHLKVEGVAVCDTQVAKDIAVKAQTPLVRRLQRQIDVVHDVYAPYTTSEPRFQMEAASRNLGTKFRLPPVVDQRFLERTLSYALQNDWGAKKPKARAPV